MRLKKILGGVLTSLKVVFILEVASKKLKNKEVRL
jgi:hypothetical protein